jgi:hypothetical protein
MFATNVLIVFQTVPIVLASIFKLKGISLGPGQSGALNEYVFFQVYDV